MKKLLFIIYTLIIIAFPVSVNAQALQLLYDGEVHNYTGMQYTLTVNGTNVATPLPPIIFNDRALVPIREVFEAMGAQVGYESDTKSITVKSESVEVNLQIDNNTAYVNGNMVSIPDGVVPKLIGRVGESAKTMVPVRFISESIGMNVVFDGENGIIGINNPSYQAPVQTPEKAVTVKSVSYAKAADGLDIKIDADNAIGEYSDLFLSEPYRVVIDISKAAMDTPQSAYDVQEGAVARVRLGQHENSTRIVVDLTEKLEYGISVSGNVMNIHIKSTGTVSSTPNVTPSVSPDTQTAKIVVLDAGHGGHDPGASGTDASGIGHCEKDITLSLVKKVRDVLVSNGVNVMLTREDDTYVELVERAEIANRANAAMFVSIHLNSVDNVPNASGTEVYFAAANNGTNYGLTSEKLAGAVKSSLVGSIGTKDRGVKQGNHVVTRTSKMPAVLVEVAFMSNVSEMTNLASDDFQNAAAQGIAQGILNSLGSVTVPQQTAVGGIEYMTD